MRRTLIFLLLVALAGMATAQTGFDNLRNIIPPSPDAASLAVLFLLIE